MVKVKPIDKVVSKWQARASAAVEDYRFGIENPKVDWATATAAAQSTWAQAVQQAAAEGRFAGGVKKAGTEKWKRKAIEVGATRYASGIAAAVSDYATAMSEVLRTLEGISLPPRGPRGDPRNYERVKIIGDTLHKVFTGKKKA